MQSLGKNYQNKHDKKLFKLGVNFQQTLLTENQFIPGKCTLNAATAALKLQKHIKSLQCEF